MGLTNSGVEWRADGTRLTHLDAEPLGVAERQARVLPHAEDDVAQVVELARVAQPVVAAGAEDARMAAQMAVPQHIQQPVDVALGREVQPRPHLPVLQPSPAFYDTREHPSVLLQSSHGENAPDTRPIRRRAPDLMIEIAHVVSCVSTPHHLANRPQITVPFLREDGVSPEG